MRPYLFLAFACLWQTAALSATPIYVAPEGSNKHKGTREAPLATIHEAAQRATAGDTVYIREGFYPIDTPIKPKNSGTPDRWIVYRNYPDERVIIDAGAYQFQGNGEHLRPSWDGAFQLENVAYIHVEGLKLTRARCVGFMVRGPKTHHVSLVRCSTDRTYSSGIGLWYADSIRVFHCDIMRANQQEMRSEGRALRKEAPHEALTIAGATNFEVAYNHIHLCDKEGIDCKEVSAHGIIHHNYVHDLDRQGLYVDSWFGLLEDVEFFGNRVHDCEWGLAISAEGEGSSMQNIRIHHNLLYDNRASGIYFGTWGHDKLRKDIHIYQNTIHRNGSPAHWASPTGGIDLRSAQLQDVFIYNNICSMNWGFEIGVFADPEKGGIEKLEAKNISISHNLTANFKSRSEEEAGFGTVYGYKGIKPVQGLPMFQNPGKGDFSLQYGSPAIRRGKGEVPADLGAIPYFLPIKTPR